MYFSIVRYIFIFHLTIDLFKKSNDTIFIGYTLEISFRIIPNYFLVDKKCVSNSHKQSFVVN